MKISHTGLLGRIRGLASRPQGIGYADALVEGITTRQLVNNGRHMVLDGDLLMVGYRHQRRYFSHAEDAKRYEVELAQIKAQPRKSKKPKPPKPPKVATPKPAKAEAKAEAKPAPVRIATPKIAFKDLPPIVPAGVKVKVIPSPAHFGPAARLAYAVPAKSVKPLKVGKEI